MGPQPNWSHKIHDKKLIEKKKKTEMALIMWHGHFDSVVQLLSGFFNRAKIKGGSYLEKLGS